MPEENEHNAEQAEPRSKQRAAKPAGLKGRGWKRWLNYQSVVKQVPFFLFLTGLAVVYIYNGHLADKTMRDINRTGKELKELQHEFKTVKSEVMFRSKQSELVKAVEPLGLKELSQAPVILNNETETKDN